MFAGDELVGGARRFYQWKQQAVEAQFVPVQAEFHFRVEKQSSTTGGHSKITIRKYFETRIVIRNSLLYL